MSARPKLSLAPLGARPRTVITRCGDGFQVATVPPQVGYEHPRTFPTHQGARGYAGGIRLARSIPIDDQTTEADRG